MVLKRLQNIRPFLAAREGALSIIFALAIMPIAGLTGMAIDFAKGSQARTDLTSLADAATVAAASEQTVKPIMAVDEQINAARSAVEREFTNQIQSQQGGSGWRLSNASYDVQSVDNIIRVKLCYTAEQETLFLKVIGISSMQIENCSTAQSAPPTFVRVYALVDASGSMGIGATYEDQALMERRLGCAFACHSIVNTGDSACDVPGRWISAGWWNMTTKCAKMIGARTRFDVVRDALIRVTEQAESLARFQGQYQISVHKFSNYLTEVQGATDNMANARTNLRNMTMDQRGAGSNFYKALADFTRIIPTSGDGRSAKTPKVFVLLLTDGIGSRVFEHTNCEAGLGAPCIYTGQWRHDPDYVLESPYIQGDIRSQAFPARLCDGLKSKNATVLTLATEFDSSNINDGHMKEVDGTLRNLSLKGLAGCASATNLAFKANLAPDVERAIATMFTTVVEKARLIR
jgi:Flp pilus assembly protein TadG/uncharacterized membrane protein